MTEAQALEIVKNVLSKVSGNLNDHNTMQQAIKVLEEALTGDSEKTAG